MQMWSLIVFYALIVILVQFFSNLLPFDYAWYARLRKPALAENQVVFRAVWPVLFFFLFFSGVLGELAVPECYQLMVRVVFSFVLLLVFLWSLFFFGYHDIQSALLVNIVLALVSLGLTIFYFCYSPCAGVLFGLFTLWIWVALYMTWYVYANN